MNEIGQYTVRLTEKEYVQLTKRRKSGKQTATSRRRAEILLHLDQNHGEVLPVKEMAQRCAISTPTIYHQNRKFPQEGYSEELFKRKKHDYPPFKITGKVEVLVIATACGEPPNGFARWTVRLLANKIVLEDGSYLSKTEINRI